MTSGVAATADNIGVPPAAALQSQLALRRAGARIAMPAVTTSVIGRSRPASAGSASPCEVTTD
jgi:hypothetical protein